MNREIINRYSGGVILEGNYSSIKDCLEENRGADLGGANLGGANLGGAYLEDANLGGANLGGANLEDADLGGANLEDAYLGGADLGGANLGGAYLKGADLGGANLEDANLKGANLEDAYLGGANLKDADLGGVKNYSESHDFFKEIIRKESRNLFNINEWAFIGQLITHRFCWDVIENKFKDEAISVFDKLAKAGFDEWKIKFNERRMKQ